MTGKVHGLAVLSAVFFLTLTPFLPGKAFAGGDPAAGRTVFEGICANCHGQEGVTEIPGIPVFANGERMDKTDEQLKKSIMGGVNNPDNPAGMSMPPYGGGPALTDKQIADVLSYIRTLKK